MMQGFFMAQKMNYFSAATKKTDKDAELVLLIPEQECAFKKPTRKLHKVQPVKDIEICNGLKNEIFCNYVKNPEGQKQSKVIESMPVRGKKLELIDRQTKVMLQKYLKFEENLEDKTAYDKQRPKLIDDPFTK